MTAAARAEHGELESRQIHAAHLGMWIFLGSEVLLFAGLFALYAAYRVHAPIAFHDGVAHATRTLGSINTGVLLVSSTLAALSVGSLERGHRRTSAALLLGTVLLGALFLVIKLAEYKMHFHDGIYPGARGEFFAGHDNAGLGPFWTLYFVTTGLHAVHVSVGMLVIGVTGIRVFVGSLDASRIHVVHNATLYWHLVDLIWIFVWPLYYLA